MEMVNIKLKVKCIYIILIQMSHNYCYDTSILREKNVLFIQNLLKYASPILVGVESLHVRPSNRSSVTQAKWLNTLETSRILIAHATIMFDNHDETLKNVIATNLRNLYRLFGIDLSDKDAWNEVTGEAMYFISPETQNSPTWVSQQPDAIMGAMHTATFESVREEFEQLNVDDEEHKNICRLIGHCIYNLVATRDNLWKTQMIQYKLLVN